MKTHDEIFKEEFKTELLIINIMTGLLLAMGTIIGFISIKTTIAMFSLVN